MQQSNALYDELKTLSDQLLESIQQPVTIRAPPDVSHINTIQQNLTRELSSRTQSYLSSQIMDSIMRNIYISKEQAPCDTEKEEYSIETVMDMFPVIPGSENEEYNSLRESVQASMILFQKFKSELQEMNESPIPVGDTHAAATELMQQSQRLLTSLDENITNGTIQTSVNQPTEKRLFHSSSEIFDDYRKRRRQQ